MSLTPHFGFTNSFVTGNKVTAAQLNWLFNIVDAQLGDVLQVIGTGVLTNPADNPPSLLTGLLASNSGSGVLVNAGGANCLETTNAYGNLLALLPTSAVLAGSEFASGPNWIFLVPQYISLDTTLDSRAGAPGLLEVRTDETPTGDGACLIAGVVNTGGTLAITDLREFANDAELWQLVAQTQSDVGYDSTARGIGSVNARLTALEGEGSGSGSGPGGSTYLTQLQTSPSNPLNAKSYVDAEDAATLAAALAAVNSNGRVPTASKTALLSHRCALNTVMMRHVNSPLVDQVPGSYISVGLGGDGTADTVNDIVFTTLVPSTDGRSLEVA